VSVHAAAFRAPRRGDLDGAAKRSGVERFLLGINYWPRSSAMAMWSRFDLGEIDEDFAHIKALGLDVVRFFLTWEAFQPAPGAVDAEALERFESVLDRALARGLETMPTLFSGHMSGVNWLPAWTLDRSARTPRFRTIAGGQDSPYASGDFYRGELLAAQRFFVRTLGPRVREHPALYAWDLGNEFSNLRAPESPRDAHDWSAALTDDLLAGSNIGVTGGIHGEDVTRENRIRPSSICEPWAFATMHGYSVYSDFARDRTDPGVVPFLAELTASCARKRVLFSEFGNPTCPPGTKMLGDYACLDEEEMALYATRVMERLHERGALGAFWWCWADYAAALARTPPFDQAPHELHFGIVRNDGSEKPVAQALAAFARERRSVSEQPAPFVDESAYYAGLPDSTRAAYEVYCRAHEGAEERS
jgi:endo-1,4-beta-mannosidase